MKLSLLFFTFFLFILLSTADQIELNPDTCPTSRHLLFFGGFNFPLGEKKSEHISSSSSSPPKYARKSESQGLTVYIRPQTSSELGHRVRSYTHLLKPKLFSKGELAKIKKLKTEKKKKQPTKKKNTTQQQATKTRDLVAINDHERDRCRALLQIDHQQNSLIPAKTTTPTTATKKSKKNEKKEKPSITSKVKNITGEAKKKVAAATKALPVKDKQKPNKEKPLKNKVTDEKVKPSKSNTKSDREEKKKPTTTKKPSSETETLTPSAPVKKSTPPPATPPPPPPVSIPSSSAHTKTKREKTTTPPPPPISTVDEDPSDISADIDQDEKNNSVVGRAYHFVKNMFQLSDDILENNHTIEEDQIISSTNEQPSRQSRKLLSVDNLDESFTNLFKRQLLSVKANNKRSTTTTATTKSGNTKEKKTNSAANKPKVGWAYRYRISRYLADQKMKRSKTGGGAGSGKSKQIQRNTKKPSSSSNTKVSKRKLLGLGSDEEAICQHDPTSNQDTVNTVLITQEFVPKRQLLATKKARKENEEEEAAAAANDDNEEEADVDNDEEDIEKMNKRRRMKSYEELTDPVEIVRSYDRGLFKPRVGWQFRYRVSRYIDSLRDIIQEDQERLKLGLEAIKRKTPQELSGRRKRVLDKPLPKAEEPTVQVEDNKPHVGWRYRYRISKMLEAKKRGEYVDDDELKRQARVEQKRKQQGLPAKSVDDDECIEWEYDIDPELRKIGEEGRRVGWAYRYRIRRKLDELKQKQAATGVPFDWETLGGGGKREKKLHGTTTPSTVLSDEKQAQENKKAVGWKYRYRVSKMLEAQKHEKAEEITKSTSKKTVQVPDHEKLDPVLARLTPAERTVGWQYRYRIRRKLDSIKNATRDTDGGKRRKKDARSAAKRKDQEKIIKKVEESIEKILNIDDIDETPFMEYFRRTSSYVFFGLLPTAQKSICLLPLPVEFSFCKDQDELDKTKKPVTQTTTTTTTGVPKTTSTKKLRTKKEKRAKQFIQSHSTKFSNTDEIIDDVVTPLTTKTTTEKPQVQRKQARQRSGRSTKRRDTNEQIKHFDEEEEPPIKKLIGVDSKKKKNKKRFQIIGQEVKTKPKHSSTTPPSTTLPPLTTTTITTTTTTTSAPIVDKPKTTTPPPTPRPPAPQTTTTTTTTTTHAPPLRTISEIIQEEADTLLSTKASFPDEVKEEINEANENLQPLTTTASTTVQNDSPTSDDEDDNESDSTDEDDDEESNTNDSESEDESTSTDEKDENYDPAPVKKMKQYYENAKESVHGVFDLKDEKDSA